MDGLFSSYLPCDILTSQPSHAYRQHLRRNYTLEPSNHGKRELAILKCTRVCRKSNPSAPLTTAEKLERRHDFKPSISQFSCPRYSTPRYHHAASVDQSNGKKVWRTNANTYTHVSRWLRKRFGHKSGPGQRKISSYSILSPYTAMQAVVHLEFADAHVLLLYMWQ